MATRRDLERFEHLALALDEARTMPSDDAYTYLREAALDLDEGPLRDWFMQGVIGILGIGEAVA